MNKESYTAASTFPSKLLHQKVIKDGKIIPIHIQLSPTNACNLNCSFCSCSDRDKEKELSLEQITNIIDVCEERGTKAITITGGGEPLMHPKINDIIEYGNNFTPEIEVGLVTNGILLSKLEHHSNLIWCRISSSDDRDPAYDSIHKALQHNLQTDWAFSHVVTKKPNYKIIKELIEFANLYDFTHVRLVSDLCDLDNVPPMGKIKEQLKSLGVDDSRVIYQGRKDSTKGNKDCYISLLKPIIAPEGVFPCCGAQYAIHGQSKDMIDKMKIGDLKDLPKILDDQKYFDGRVCDVCYYDQYNQSLEKLLNKPKHLNFV